MIDPSDNPYAPPQADCSRPLGTHRYYGLMIAKLKFAELRKITRNPLIWCRLTALHWLGGSRAVIVTGVVNPQSPLELHVAEFPSQVRERLATKHDLLSQHGFRWVGNYRSPAIGAGQSVGDLWIDDNNTICLNLLIQTLVYPRATVVAEHLSLFSSLADGTMTITTSYPISIAENPTHDVVRLPGIAPVELIRRHRERLAVLKPRQLTPQTSLSEAEVWSLLHHYLLDEICSLERAGVVTPIDEAQVAKLHKYNVCFDFRERKVPWMVRLFSSKTISLVFYLVAIVGVISRWPNSRIWMYVGMFWFCLTLLFSNQLIYSYLRAKPQDLLPPRQP